MIPIMKVAKSGVFWTGRSQAVSLPKEFRFETDTVLVRREGQAVILEPLPSDPKDGWSLLPGGPMTSLGPRRAKLKSGLRSDEIPS